MNASFTKELKADAVPRPTVSLRKALKLRPKPTRATRELPEAAGLIKALHRSGGEPLLKDAVPRSHAAGAHGQISNANKLEKSAAPAPIDGLDPSVQARLDREIAVANVKASLRQPGVNMGWRRAP